MSSNELQPAWIPYVSTKVAEDILVFSLKIMTGLYFFSFRLACSSGCEFHFFFFFSPKMTGCLKGLQRCSSWVMS